MLAVSILLLSLEYFLTITISLLVIFILCIQLGLSYCCAILYYLKFGPYKSAESPISLGSKHTHIFTIEYRVAPLFTMQLFSAQRNHNR